MMLDLSRSLYSLAEWTQILDNELAAGRPVFYSGSSTDGGHQFICDGSDGQGLYHINWGWGGYQNGYFDVTILNPEKGGVGSGNAQDGYNRSCSMLVGVAPDNGKLDEPVAPFVPIVQSYWDKMSVFELTKDTRNQVSDKFALKIQNYFCNQSRQKMTGSIAYGILKSDGTYVPISGVKEFSFKGILDDGRTYGNTFLFEFDYAFPIGQTTIYAIYCTDGVHWNKCANSEMRPYVVEATAQKLTQVRSQLKADVTADVELLSGMENEFKVKISNDADFDYMGILYIYFSASKVMPEQAVSDLYVTVPAHTTIERTVVLSPEAGDLYLWILEDKTNTTLVTAKKFEVSTSTAPVLSMVRAWSNATPGLYETENAVYAGTNKVKAPKVEGDKAVFSYDIKNDGGTAIVRYGISSLNCETWHYRTPSEGTVRLPGNGAVTTISGEFTPEEVGSKTIRSGFYFLDDGVTYSTSLPKNKLYTINDPNSWYTLEADKMVVYVACSSTDISSVASSSSYVYGGNGEIVILSDVSKHLNVYNLNGQKVTDVNLTAGELQRISIATGIYVVGGKKIVVK